MRLLLTLGALALAAVIGFAQAPPKPAVAGELPYRLAPGDVIDIKLFFNPELNEQVQIRPDGQISLQLAGEVTLAGLTIREASDMLEEVYRKELRTPRVTIQVKTFGARKIYVTGEVLRPGPLLLSSPTTLFEAISEAGGIKNTGNRDLAILIRKGADGKPIGRKVALMLHGSITADAATPLTPFDVVIVPESKIARVDRWVDQNIRQLIPINTSAGFTYLFQNSPGPALPIF